jgi:hypothetical protein
MAERGRNARPLRRVLLLIALLIAVTGSANDSASVLLNGDLTKGAGNSPDHWRTEGWLQEPDVSTYNWNHTGPHAELSIASRKSNDARWMQSITLEPGWYLFEAEVRTEDVPQNATGASISLLEDGIMSEDVHGTNDWRRLSFNVKIGKHGADVDLALRLGGFSSLNTGRAFFRNVKGLRLSGLPSSGERQFDLETIRQQSAGAPIGRPWSLVAVFIMLGAIAWFGWRTFGAATETPADLKAVPGDRPRKAARR